jgi:hypothetical protein
MRKAAVDFVGIFAVSLIETAIEKDALAVDFKQGLGAGGGSCRAAKFEFHELLSSQ